MFQIIDPPPNLSYKPWIPIKPSSTDKENVRTLYDSQDKKRAISFQEASKVQMQPPKLFLTLQQLQKTKTAREKNQNENAFIKTIEIEVHP